MTSAIWITDKLWICTQIYIFIIQIDINRYVSLLVIDNQIDIRGKRNVFPYQLINWFYDPQLYQICRIKISQIIGLALNSFTFVVVVTHNIVVWMELEV